MFEIHRIRSIEDPWFELAYEHLWNEFGGKGEMELRETLAARFRLAPAMAYEMVFVRKDGSFAAVRDHTVIPTDAETVVHLSHNLVAPEFRRSGLAGWMRAFPVLSARQFRPDTPITLVAEMEHDDGTDAQCGVRLQAYEKAGFRKIDPAKVKYHQPDFRSEAAIDAAGGAAPLPFLLLLRRVGREGESTLSGGEARRIVQALYRMYGAQFRAKDMAHPLLDFSTYPADDATVDLLSPTA